MIEQLIYRRAEQGYRTVAVSEGLMGKGLARRIEALSTLPPSSGKKRLGAQPVFSRCAVEDGLAMLMTVIDPGGIRGSHLTHAWYVPPEDVSAFAAGNAIPVGAYQTAYMEKSRMDALPALSVDSLPKEDTAALGCEAAAMFAGNVPLLSQFLQAVVRCGVPTAGRGYLGVCVLSDEDEDSLTVRASRLMETVLRAYPLEKVRTVGYRSLWNKAEDNVRYPVFFTTPDLIGSAAAVPMNYVLFDLRSGEVRLPRGVELKPDNYDRSIAQAMASGDARSVRDMLAQEIRRKAEEEARRRAEEEARRKAEEEARAAEQRRLAEEEQRRQAAEARRLYQEQQRKKAEEDEKRRIEAEEKKRRYEEEQRAKAEEAARKTAEENDRQKRMHEAYLRARAEQEQERREAELKKAEEARLARAELDKKNAERQQAAVKTLNEQRSREEQTRRTTQSVQRPDTLNRFLSDLHLAAKDIPAHELDKKTNEYIKAVARGSGCAPLDYAARLLGEIAATLRDRSRQLPPMACVVIARCAYSVADSVIGEMFADPAGLSAQNCAAALAETDALLDNLNHPAAGAVSRQRRDKWYVWLEVLQDRPEKARMRACVKAVCALHADNVNGALETMQRTLEEAACIMIEKCAVQSARAARNILLRRAALAEVYVQIRFNRNGQPAWDQNLRFGGRLLNALDRIGMAEQFERYVNQLIDEITG